MRSYFSQLVEGKIPRIKKDKKMKELHYKTCPYCEGAGKIARLISESRHRLYSIEEKKTAYDLWRNGVTLREIGEQLGVNHPQKVKHMIESYGNHLLKQGINQLKGE